MPADRVILHVDMDAFFAAIAVLDDPSLKGKAVLTGGTGPRGVVTTASYEARKYGCRSAMPTAQALRLCPHAVCVKVPGERIREKSRQVFELLDAFSPLVQPVSVDEAFLDLTGSTRLLGDGKSVAEQLRRRIRDETGLTASVGVAPNKFLAKLASDLDKPDGLVVITPENLDATLNPLPVSRLWGVGPATQRTLERHHLRTIGDLRRLSEDRLSRLLGKLGPHLYRLSRGIDDRPVVSDRHAKSIGQERTFGQDLDHPEEVRQVMLQEAEQVARRLRRKSVTARGVTVKIRFGDYETITRSTVLGEPTDATAPLFAAAKDLFDRWAAHGFRPVRLIGVTATHLDHGPQQLDLFADPSADRDRRVDTALDAIAERFGDRAVHRGTGPER